MSAAGGGFACELLNTEELKPLLHFHSGSSIGRLGKHPPTHWASPSREGIILPPICAYRVFICGGLSSGLSRSLGETHPTRWVPRLERGFFAPPSVLIGSSSVVASPLGCPGRLGKHTPPVGSPPLERGFFARTAKASPRHFPGGALRRAQRQLAGRVTGDWVKTPPKVA
jgi:hypothetical protein